MGDTVEIMETRPLSKTKCLAAGPRRHQGAGSADASRQHPAATPGDAELVVRLPSLTRGGCERR